MGATFCHFIFDVEVINVVLCMLCTWVFTLEIEEIQYLVVKYEFAISAAW